MDIDCETELEDVDCPLGSGGFGMVRLARWNNTLVAVKHLTYNSPKRDIIHDLRREVLVHQGLHFPFVVHLYGASTTKPNLCLVMEHARGGESCNTMQGGRDYRERIRALGRYGAINSLSNRTNEPVPFRDDPL